MKLIDALTKARFARQREGDPFVCFLAAGFNPLHLETFLTAELADWFPDNRIEISTGLYGDLLGNIRRLEAARPDAGVILIEWSDLDPRLGIRSAGGWTASVRADILLTVKRTIGELEEAIKRCSHLSIVLSFPTLPLPPVSFTPSWQAGAFELELTSMAQLLMLALSRDSRIRILSLQRNNVTSSGNERFQVQSELSAGFPYNLSHAASLAAGLSRIIVNPRPKKGLITDLDDTLWRGIVGDVGVDSISWDLNHHSQMHAVYQQVLHALSTEGVYVGVASKNEPSVVEQAFGRADLLLPKNAIFPMEIGWQPKSEAIGRILKTWNIGAEAAVFIDDSPLELAEVKAAHPAIECLCFPTNDSAAIYSLVLKLRDMFGRTAISAEDSIRVDSMRKAHEVAVAAEETGVRSGDFLKQTEAEITFNFDKDPLDPRALELVNKTNQFNLNGKRFAEGPWRKYLEDPSAFLLITSYKDKYGQLGKIAILAGRIHDKALKVDSWVMSCRAFSRQIEYRCLEKLFDKFDVEEIELSYTATNKNMPMREFLTELLGTSPVVDTKLTRGRFTSVCPVMYQRVREISDVQEFVSQ
jgi:FkbH-like protein